MKKNYEKYLLIAVVISVCALFTLTINTIANSNNIQTPTAISAYSA